ncbi:MAG: hypothetical protein GVY33_07080, partial [Alphaproteobacteria bacterium]|nr:hypothetical protein [Alphaproteobacteria bacterium]
MSGRTNLYRRGTMWWWRRRLPPDLRARGAKSEIRLSTRAHIASDARTAAARLWLAVDRAIDRAREEESGMPLTGRDIDQLVRTLAQEALAAGERERALAPPRSDAEIDEAVAARHERAEAWRTALARRDVDGVRPQVDAALAGAGIALADDPDRRILMREAAKAQVEVARIEAARERGHYDVAASGGDAPWPWRAAAPLTVSAPVAHAALGPAGVTAAGAAAPVVAMAATPAPTAHREAPTASAAPPPPPPAERPGDATPSAGPAAPAAGAGAATDAAPAIRVGDAFDLLTEKLVAEGKTSMLRQVEGARTLACELLTEPEENP